MMHDEIDNETLERAEREALVRPSNSAMWDERLYTTHAPVMSWAERGDDILAESNYLMILEQLRGVAAWEDRDNQETPDEYVIDATISDWLVGSLRQIFVRVRDEAGEYTHVFRESVRIALELRDYPVFNESDYSEREWAEWERQFDDALSDARNEYERELDDGDAPEGLHEAICQRINEIRQDGSGFEFGELPDVDYSAVSERYKKIADEISTAGWEAYARKLTREQVGADQLSLL